MSWFTITELGAGTYQISEPFVFLELRYGISTANMYLVVGKERAALIDGGLGIGDVRAAIARITDLPCMVLNTHFHWDHIGANADFSQRAIHHSEGELVARDPDLRRWREVASKSKVRSLLPSSFDPVTYQIAARPPTRLLHDGNAVDLGGRALRVLHVPGHSPGHVSYLDEAHGLLFTGDCAMRGPVFACFEGGDPEALVSSAERLAGLPGVTTVCPGHNAVIAETGWLDRFAACAAMAVQGEAPAVPRDEFFVGREVDFGEFSIWLPQ